MSLQPLNVAIESVWIRRFVVVVIGEEDYLYVGVEVIFFRTGYGHWRARPMIYPVSDIGL
jgi:hypothetical protein